MGNPSVSREGEKELRRKSRNRESESCGWGATGQIRVLLEVLELENEFFLG